MKSIQDSRKLLRVLEELSQTTTSLEEKFTDELYLFFGYLERKILKEVDLDQPLDAIFYQQVQGVIDKYWNEYEEIFSTNVDKAYEIGLVHGELLLSAVKADAKGNTAIKGWINEPFFKPNAKVSRRLKTYKFEATEHTKSRVTDEINNTLAEAYREGWGRENVTKVIQNKFADLKTWEARRIAVTEVNSARNIAHHNQLKADKIQYGKWVSAKDDDVRDSHKKVNGEIVPIDERFSNGLLHPGDKNGTPIKEWVNCRCTEVAFIIPLGYAAPDFFPFHEEDLVKVGSTDPKDYLKLPSDVIETPEVITPEVPTQTPADIDNMTSRELYETMTKADKAKYDKAKQMLENYKNAGIEGELYKKMAEKPLKTIHDLERKQIDKLKKSLLPKAKPVKKVLTKAQQKDLKNFKKEIPIDESTFEELTGWADKRCKGQIEWGYQFNVKTGKLHGDEIRGVKGKVTFEDIGEDFGSVHVHTEEGMSFPSDDDIISYRCERAKDHLVFSPDEVWYIYAEDNFGILGKAMQLDVSRAYNKCIKEGNAEVEELMRKGKIKLDEKSIKKAADKHIGDKLLEEFSKPYWKDKGIILRRAYR